MSLFPCRQCLCVENTACCRYWHNRAEGKLLLCSACDPEIRQWHGLFPQKSAAGMLIDQRGHLWSQQVLDQGGLPPSFTIVGAVMLPEQPREEAPGDGDQV